MSFTTLQLSRVIDRLYETALQPEVWPEALELVAQALSSTAATLLVHDFKTGRFPFGTTNCGYPLQAIDEYMSYYAAIDVIREGTRRYTEGELGTGEMLASTDDPRYREIQNDFYVRWGFGRVLGGYVLNQPNYGAVLAVHRAKSSADYSSEEIARCSLIAPHLARAIRIRHELTELKENEGASLDALEHVTLGVAFLDRQRRVVRMNRAAREITAANDGLTVTDGHLHPTESSVRAALDGALGSNGEERRDTFAVTRPSGKPPYSIFVTPMRVHPELLGSATSAVFITNTDSQPRDGLDALRQTYGLSPTEARLAIALCEGKSPQTISDEWMTSIHTVRSQVKALQRKMGARSQSEIILRATRGPLAFRR